MSDEPPKRRLNRAQKRALEAAEVAVFAKQYGCKAQRGCEPNDRKYDREVERRLSRMDPRRLDALLRDDED